tara:strand:- start:6742 stop:6972 length:231 start_codon:yes stop_codon:yes gene_type:complete
MPGLRAQALTKIIHQWAKGALPTLPQPEIKAPTAREVRRKAELFSGGPVAQTFLDSPVQTLSTTIDDRLINQEAAQ